MADKKQTLMAYHLSQFAKQAYLGKVSCMCCNLVCYDACLDIIPVWQPQVLLGSHIAQQGSSCAMCIPFYTQTQTSLLIGD